MKFLNDAQQKLVCDHLAFADDITQRYVNLSDQNYQDIRSIALIGLCKAAISFDAKKGFRFSSLAYPCMQNEILMYFRKEKNINNISIEESIYSKNCTELFLKDTLQSTDEDFCLDIENRIMFQKCMNIILNKLNKDERRLMLLTIANISQTEIAKIFKLERSSVSKRTSNIRKKIKEKLYLETFYEIYFFCDIDKYCIIIPKKELNKNDFIIEERFSKIFRILKNDNFVLIYSIKILDFFKFLSDILF